MSMAFHIFAAAFSNFGYRPASIASLHSGVLDDTLDDDDDGAQLPRCRR